MRALAISIAIFAVIWPSSAVFHRADAAPMLTANIPGCTSGAEAIAIDTNGHFEKDCDGIAVDGTAQTKMGTGGPLADLGSGGLILSLTDVHIIKRTIGTQTTMTLFLSDLVPVASSPVTAEASIDGNFPVNQRVGSTTKGDSVNFKATVNGTAIGAPFVVTTVGSQNPETFTDKKKTLKLEVTGKTATLQEELRVTLLQGGDQVSFPGSADTGIASVPEPTTFALFGLGTLGLLAYRWRRSTGSQPT